MAGGMVYLMKFYDAAEPEEIISSKSTALWPQSVIHFYERRLSWYAPQNIRFGPYIPTEVTATETDADVEEVLCEF